MGGDLGESQVILGGCCPLSPLMAGALILPIFLYKIMTLCHKVFTNLSGDTNMHNKSATHKQKAAAGSSLLKLPIALAALTALPVFLAAQTQGVDAVVKSSIEISKAGAASQQRIERLQSQTETSRSRYRALLLQLRDLNAYNNQKQRIITRQGELIDVLNKGIAEVAVIQRQLPPMMERMLLAVEQFIELDTPFYLDERRDRIEQVRANMLDPNVSSSERLRQVLEVYRIEVDYGKKIDWAEQSITVDGEELVVNVLRFGRVAYLAQTGDERRAFAWNQDLRRWEQIPARYRAAIRQALRMARKQASLDMVVLPVRAAH